MRIIIAGAGEVGTYLAKMLVQENHDIVLMDQNEERLNFLNNLEIMTMVGNPASISDLIEAGVKKTDIFIGVTPEETANITACMLASNLGAQRTVARIINYEYLDAHNSDFFKKMGIDSLICPELLASKEIVNAFTHPWARQWWELGNGALILIAVKVRENAPIANRYLSDLLIHDEKLFHIVAIKRGDETIIPGGADRIKPDDLLFFTTTPDHIYDVRQQAGKRDSDIKNVVIIGGSRIALKVAEIAPRDIRVKIIEVNRAKSQKIAEQMDSNVMVINDDGRNTDFLIQENVQDCDAFISLTENAATNILACLSAKSLGIPKTIAQVETINYLALADKFDIGTIINKKMIAASHIYQFSLDADVENVKCLTFANADVAEFVARPGSKITRKQVKDFRFPSYMTLGGLIRDGKAIIIQGDTQIQANDHVMIFCMNASMHKLEDYFN